MAQPVSVKFADPRYLRLRVEGTRPTIPAPYEVPLGRVVATYDMRPFWDRVLDSPGLFLVDILLPVTHDANSVNS